MSAQDSTHPLLSALTSRLAGDDALVRAASQARRWQRRKRSDGNEQLTESARRMIEDAITSLGGGARGDGWVSGEEAEAVTVDAERRIVIAEGLRATLRAKDQAVRERAQVVARQALGHDADDLVAALDEAVRADRVLVEALGWRRKKKKPGMTHCAKCNSLRLPDANCPSCGDAPTMATDEQEMAQQQVDGSTGEVMVEAAGGAALALRGRSGGAAVPPAAPTAGAAGGEFETVHPRGRGGKWIAKGAGLGTEGPDPQVKQLQERLSQLGFQVDQNGGFGTTTEEAVKSFQQRYGLPVTGQVDEVTVAMMRNPPPLTAAQAEKGLSTTTAAQVLAMQRATQGLQAIGYDTQNPEASLRKLQKDYGLRLTGKPDAATMNLIQRIQTRDAKQAKAGGFLSADELSTPSATGSPAKIARPAALTHAATEDPEEGNHMPDENEIDEASYSSGGSDTNTPIPQTFGGFVPVSASARSIGGQPGSTGASNLADPADRTPGMDDFFGDEPVQRPPNLRVADAGFERCATCVHHNGKRLCAKYSAGTDKDDLCDSYFSLSPVEQVSAANYYTGMLGQVQEGKQHTSMLKVAREKLEEAVRATGGDELRDEIAALTEAHLLLDDARAQAVAIIANRRIRQAQNMLDESAIDDSGDALADWLLDEAKPSSAERDKMPDSAFAIPAKREYPIHDEAHARNALARVAQHGSPAEKKQVRAAVKKRHPKVVQEALVLLSEVKSSAYPNLERKPGKQNWVDYAGGLPDYIERIAKHIHYEHGHPIGQAIQFAVGTVRRWCAGGSVSKGGASKSNVSAKTKAQACAAVAEWEAKKKKGGAAQRAAGKSLKEALASGVAVLDETTAVMLAIEEAEALDLPPVNVSLEEAERILEEVELHEASFPGSLHFDPTLHPRGRKGEFTDVLSRMMKSSSKVSEITLPHGVTVKKNRLGHGVTVHQGGRKLGSYTDAGKAADHAIRATGMPEPERPHYGIVGKRYAVAFEDSKGMKNEEIVAHAMNGSSVNRRGKNISAVTHEGGHSTTIYSYKEPLAHIDHETRMVHLNSHKFSATTTQHQNIVHRAAADRGYSVRPIDRAEARRRAGLSPDETFEKAPAGGAKAARSAAATERAVQVAQDRNRRLHNEGVERAERATALGRVAETTPHLGAAERIRAGRAEQAKAEVLEAGRDTLGNPHVRLGKKLPNGTYLEADAKLHKLEGNADAHFSVTGTIWKSEAYAKRSRADHAMLTSGAISDTVAKHMPELKQVANMHLADSSGAPMHAAANGWYWYSDYDGKGVHALGDSALAKMTPHERAAHHLRVSPDALPKNMGKEQFEAHVKTLKPQWQAEADQARSTLESFGQRPNIADVEPRDYAARAALHDTARRQAAQARIGTTAERPGDKGLVGDKGGGETRYGTGTTATFSRPGSHNYPNLPNGHELVASIKPGTRVTIMSPQGQERSGKAVMRSSGGGWVLNMGGAHGTPGLVDHRNIVRLGNKRKLREVAADVTAKLPNLAADPNMAALLKAEEATMVRLPLADVLVKHGSRIDEALRVELREALEDIAPKDESERRLAEAREQGDKSKIELYETLVSAVS